MVTLARITAWGLLILGGTLVLVAFASPAEHRVVVVVHECKPVDVGFIWR